MRESEQKENEVGGKKERWYQQEGQNKRCRSQGPVLLLGHRVDGECWEGQGDTQEMVE
jgi:hypothetical protein